MAEFQNRETTTARGGCIDRFVQVISLGKYGVEATIVTPQRKLKPTNIPRGVKPGDTFRADEDSPAMIALRTGKPVVVDNFDQINRPQVSLRVVRNRRP